MNATASCAIAATEFGVEPSAATDGALPEPYLLLRVTRSATVVLSEDSRSSGKFMHGIKVLMAKNYIDNLGEEVRKGMIEKARQSAMTETKQERYTRGG